jgi:tetratricopeptide (TPR) repeat protein
MFWRARGLGLIQPASSARSSAVREMKRSPVRSAFAIVALLALALASCSKRKDPPHKANAAARPDASAAAKPLRRKPKSTTELATTSADIYLGNLDGKIEELTRLTREYPDLVSNVVLLSSAHHTRGRFRGDLDELQLGIDGTSKCAKLDPENAACPLMRAEQEQSLHRFKEARADVARARELGADPSRIADLEMDLDWNDGRYETAIEAIRKARRARPSTATWIREAQLDHDLGLEDEADAAFEAAEDLIFDTGPLVVAHLNLQRGIQKTQTGRLEEACVFFREAILRMPTYVAANEHLAETLHALGQDDEATRIYEKVVQLTDDPEFMHALAELYAARGKAEEARALQTKARTRYAELLKKYPEAMYWHASEFYLATGDTKQALDLLQKNVALRPNSMSFVALARAELVNGRGQDAKKSIDKALAMPVLSASLFWTAARIYRSIGDVAAADAYRTRAERLNPRVAQDEPEEDAGRPK